MGLSVGHLLGAQRELLGAPRHKCHGGDQGGHAGQHACSRDAPRLLPKLSDGENPALTRRWVSPPANEAPTGKTRRKGEGNGAPVVQIPEPPDSLLP